MHVDRAVAISFVVAVALPAAAPAQRAPAASAQSSPPISAEFLRPGDSVWVEIYPESTLSGGYSVDGAGGVDFHQLGRTLVTRMTPDSLRRHLVEGYSVRLRDPSISVRVFRRITVDGAVQRPGPRSLDPTITIAQAVADAGVLPTGRNDRVRLERNGQVFDVSLRPGSPLRDERILSGDHLTVPERPWIQRNTGILVGVVGALSSIAVALIIR